MTMLYTPLLQTPPFSSLTHGAHTHPRYKGSDSPGGFEEKRVNAAGAMPLVYLPNTKVH